MSPPQILNKEIDTNIDSSNVLMKSQAIESTSVMDNDVSKLEPCDSNPDISTDMIGCEKIEIKKDISENEQSKADAYETHSSPNCKITEDIEPSFAALTTEDTKLSLSTIVFFDLETTGLVKTVGKKNVQITEFTMIAVSLKDFCKCTFPDMRDVRVVQKLSLCIKPRCSISRESAYITGLTDANLEDQGEFDENIATLVTSFLSHLKKPVCILAHNGKLFDFPILKAEFEKLNIQLPSDVYIIDTLIAFRKIGVPTLPLNQTLHKDVKFKLNGNISYALQNLHLYFFGKNPVASHSSEGDCIALAKVCHKMRDRIVPWIEENCFKFDAILCMW